MPHSHFITNIFVFLCSEAYDAQIANLELEKDSTNRTIGKLTENSRIGIYAKGPHTGGNAVSYSLLIKTEGESEMILFHYGNSISKENDKDIFTLTLNNGTPMLYISHAATLKPSKQYYLNDGSWHHVEVTMPTNNCMLSDVIIYVDRQAVETTAMSDTHIFFVNGKLSIGGFGYSSELYESQFPHLLPFIGEMDEFQMWS